MTSVSFTSSNGSFDVQTGLFIDGEWTAAASGASFPVLNPATAQEIAQVADAGVDDARRALDAAVAAQEEWGSTTTRERSDILRKAYELILERADDIAQVISTEMGKPLREAKIEATDAAEMLRWFSEQVQHQTGNFAPAPKGGYRIITTYQPVGPSYLVTPWNFPVSMGARKAGAALAAGCTVVIKPSDLTPLTMSLFVQILHEAGVPAGVLNLVPTVDAPAQSADLMKDERLRKVSFTGSTPVGTQLLKQAADNVMAASMELGGNGPFLVLSKANVRWAAKGAAGLKFRNAGQVCISANRIIVHKDVADEFKQIFLEEVARLRVGAGTDPETTVGPLISDRQRDRVQGLLADAQEKGATVLAGGDCPDSDGYFLNPTVVENAPLDSDIATTEIFGPVASLYIAESDEEAIRIANDTRFGLVAYVYSQDIMQAMRAAEALEVGMVGLNRPAVADPAAPFGGVKASGLGKEGGHNGIEEYQIEKLITMTV